MAISKITTSGVSADTLTAADLAPNSVDSSELVDGSIDTSHIGDDQVTADKLANSINTDIATGVAALPKAGGTMTGNIVMGDDTSIGIADDAERIEFDGAGDISVLGANLGVGKANPTTDSGGVSLGDGSVEIAKSGANSGLIISTWSATNGHHSTLTLLKSSNATIGTNAAGSTIADDEAVGEIAFRISEGDTWTDCADIRAEVDGGIGDDDNPGRLIFRTTTDGSHYPSEKMRIHSNGSISMNSYTIRSITVNEDYTITISGLTTLTGGAWRQFGLRVTHSMIGTGMQGPETESFLIRIYGLSTWSGAVGYDIVGTSNITASNASSTGLTIVIGGTTGEGACIVELFANVGSTINVAG